MNDVLVEGKAVCVRFPGPRSSNRFARRGQADALIDIDVRVAVGETVGIVGESGSGKSTLAKTLLGLVPRSSGTIAWSGVAAPMSAEGVRRLATRDAQLVFQDPFGSLNPMMTVLSAIAEVLRRRGRTRRDAAAEARSLIEAVHLPASSLDRYPSEFSGGQRQRIVIARALAASPRLLVCDEPLSALDVSTQSRMIALFIELRERYGMAMLFIGHDLAVVHQLSDRMLVMHHGCVVEQGAADDVYLRPREAYTQKLIESIPVPDPAVQRARRARRFAASGR